MQRSPLAEVEAGLAASRADAEARLTQARQQGRQLELEAELKAQELGRRRLAELKRTRNAIASEAEALAAASAALRTGLEAVSERLLADGGTALPAMPAWHSDLAETVERNREPEPSP